MIRFVNARRAEIVAAQEPGYEDCIEECPHCGKSSLLLLSHQPKRKFMACCTAPERIPRVPFDENLSHPYVPHNDDCPDPSSDPLIDACYALNGRIQFVVRAAYNKSVPNSPVNTFFQSCLV